MNSSPTGGSATNWRVYDEYPAHPQAGEGPWHLLPKGPVTCSAQFPATVQGWRCALGERLVITGAIPGVLRYTQTLTLWDGIDRVECRTEIDEFTGADKLLRLRWPCPVPGAMPVSEVGDAVIGRGFGLLHAGAGRGGRRAAPVHPGQPGLRLVRAVRHPAGAHRRRRRGRSRSPRWSPPARRFDERALMVALVRAGVTATCSAAGRPRYGDLSVDSNLPDARIALGHPDENAFTAAVLETSPEHRAELDRQIGATGAARVWVPAAAPLAREWVPGADLTGVRALPVLVVVGGVDALVDDIADAEIIGPAARPGRIWNPSSSATVAVFNRGVPGFAVEPDGTLHTSLMRSCTGWPSGTWIDPPRRTAPDGSNFGLQHWTHTFDYAVVAGAGDWRDSEIPHRSAAFSHPLMAVRNRRAGTDGLPAHGALLDVDSDGGGSVQLGALKAAGNPLAAGSVRRRRPRHGGPADRRNTRPGHAIRDPLRV